ncbi:MAG: hypothetical protein GY702_05090 [Desulfobulbaceae bacterium]|nr:hypothetical protein [Desulfobulbaceae bacterium]
MMFFSDRFFHLLQNRRLRLPVLPLLISLALITGGCAEFNCTRLENILGGSTNLVEFSYQIAESLITRAQPALIPFHPDMPVVVTTIVDNNNLVKTTKFGRLLQEHISSRFAQMGYTVREIKLGNSLYIEPRSGETILTRDLTLLEGGNDAQAILVGTFSRSNRMLYISTRLVNPVNNNIIASDDYRLCMDNDIASLLGFQVQNGGPDMIDDPGQPILNKLF